MSTRGIIARATGEATLIPGVTWIFPPTKNNPHETLKRVSRKSA